MKTVFIVNPSAGKKKDVDDFISKIRMVKGNAEIYITTAVGDAMRYVKEYIASNGGARFITCGGDGTLGEVVNGVAENDNCEVGVIPMGAGNDFCRNFDAEYEFFNIQSQVNGESEKCDVISYKTNFNGKINIINNVSRLRFVSLLSSYMKVTVLKRKGVEKIIVSEKCSKVTVTPNDGNMRSCIDGEITDAGKTEFKIIHNGINFVIPKEKVLV